LATGVASFGHISGVHYQNQPDWAGYVGAIDEGRLPLFRGLKITPHQALIREMILQLKKGHLDAGYFRDKFHVEIVEHWQDEWQSYADEGWLSIDGDRIELSRAGLLRVDGLLPAFFEPEHQGVRYT
jgi:oxygen-independent coproporphyrinogen-3 oxidase